MMWIGSADVVEVPLAGPHVVEIPTTSSRPLLVLLRRGEQSGPGDAVPSARLTSSDFIAGLIIGPSSAHRALDIITACRCIVSLQPSTCALFVEERDPPRVIYREDPPVDVLLVPAQTFRDAVGRSRDPEHAVYLGTSTVLRDAKVRQLLVRVIGAPAHPSPAPAVAPVTGLVPHRGEFEMFRGCMHFLAHQWTSCQRTQVYFDEVVSDQHEDWLASKPAVEAYTSSRPGAGPYPGRHLLTSRAATPWVLFQDSDDAPCADRVTRLAEALSEGDDLLGSHEVRVDEFREIAFPVRYPLDVNAAVAREGGHALLHPTSIVRTSAYLRSGGFSTHRIMGSDTQFLLRAHFSMRIRNLDAFLYVKRDRAGSLTRAPATALGCPERLHFEKLWVKDFFRISRGEASLDQTELAVQHRGDVAIERIEPGGMPGLPAYAERQLSDQSY